MSYALAARIPPGKTEAVRRLFADSLGPHKTDYDDLQQRAGLTEEAYWLQTDPEGDLLIVVSNRDQAAFMEIMADPQSDYERWIRDQLEEAFGFDASAPAGSPNELLGTWSS